MVRSKLGVAVPVPCDGPIYHVRKGQVGDEAKNELLLEERGVKEALDLLLRDKPGDEGGKSASLRLWIALTSASQTRDQLQALQSYRSTVLHLERNGEIKELSEFVASFRVLQELALAHDIPNPLRRAVQSSLDSLSGILGGDADIIRNLVVQSLWSDRNFWSRPVGSLFETLNYEPTRNCLLGKEQQALSLLNRYAEAIQPTLERSSCEVYLEASTAGWDSDVASAVKDGLEIASALKLFMTSILPAVDQSVVELAPLVDRMASFLYSLICCQATPFDGLSVVGVVYGQALLFGWKCMFGDISSDEAIAREAAQVMERIRQKTGLPSLNMLAVIQGLAATLPDSVVSCGSPPPFLVDPLGSTLLHFCLHESDSATRLSALCGLQTLLNRCYKLLSLENVFQDSFDDVKTLADATLEIVLQAWECPPDRQVATAIPNLFRSLIQLLEALNESDASMENLIRRVLQQAPNKKGKYLALERLVPVIGAEKLIGYAGNTLIQSLVSGICDRGDSVGAIADLLGKLLYQLRQQMDERARRIVRPRTLNKRERRRIERERRQGKDTRVLESTDDDVSPLLDQWVRQWAPHFAAALLDPSASRRKQAAAFCIPLLVTIVGGPTRRYDASFAFEALLNEVEEVSSLNSQAHASISPESQMDLSLDDRVIWAYLEIARQALGLKVMISLGTSRILRNSLSKHVSLGLLRASLVHASSSVRLAAYQAIEAIVPIYNSSADSFSLIETEVALYEYALPPSLKADGKEHISRIMSCLASFLDRFSALEAENLGNEGEPVKILPRLSAFVCDFLVSTLLLQQGAYPGTVYDKEVFSLALYRIIMNFAVPDTVATFSDRQIPKRRILPVEKYTRNAILKKLLSTESTAALFSMLHSLWDQSRTFAFSILCDLADLAHRHHWPLPATFTACHSLGALKRRGLFLASSPRQREADTGARILAFLYMILPVDTRKAYLGELLLCLSTRVDMMANGLSVILGREARCPVPEDSLSSDGHDLPLGHGLLHTIRLVIESSPDTQLLASASNTIADTCCKAIELSLDIVADVKESNGQNCPDFHLTDGTPVNVNVNTGAIAANATYSSVELVDEEAMIKHLATQRVIVGSWLLIKEACATLASAITINDTVLPPQTVQHSCSLLVDTLTSLKHQGAAFAAHKAFQSIASWCLVQTQESSRDNVAGIPPLCGDRLMLEISSTERVRDSTLRRSTGYGLGFLSLMRAEVGSPVMPKKMGSSYMMQLLRLSLPPSTLLSNAFSRLQCTPDFAFLSLMQGSKNGAASMFVPDSEYESRCRVHALNIIRLVILDAPLAGVSKPFIGDAIISSLLGYNDSLWAVRNSATMVFSAAMLRVVDADKNAAQKDKASGNAISATELFRSYPALSQVLCSMMEHSMTDQVFEKEAITSKTLHPPLFPILLLLSRLQPVSVSGSDSAVLIGPFVEVIMKCLGHRHNKVRVVAARALANIASGSADHGATPPLLIQRCFRTVTFDKSKKEKASWNEIHGALLGILHLLRASDNPCQLTQTHQELVEKLFAYVAAVQCPPPCSSVSLQILLDVVIRGTPVSLRERHRLLTASVGVTRRLDRTAACATIVGAAELGAVSAQVACQLCCSEIWNIREDMKEGLWLWQCTEWLKELLEHNVIDVRLSAAKAFKKSLFHDVIGSTGRSCAQIVLESLVPVLHGALRTELSRAQSDSCGCHPPTVRRLSRCLLECIGLSEMLVPSNGKIDTSALWQCATQMLGTWREEPVGQGMRTDDPLAGNAVELMAQTIRLSNDMDDHLSKASTFVSTIKHCTGPHVPWRLRYSVAVSIESSGLPRSDMARTIKDDEAKVLDLSRKLQLDAYQVLLGLLQDSDSDVRSAAGRAALPTKDTMSTTLTVLKKAYLRAPDFYSGQDAVNRMLTMILDNCRGLDSFLQSFENETKHTRDKTATNQDLQNVGTDRRIFEEEEANPFDEILLTNQLAAIAIVGLGATPQGPTRDEILRTSRLVLDYIEAQQSNDVAHEITRNNIAFPMIHSLILACIALCYSGADMSCVKEQARQIVKNVENADTTLHPRITEALLVLSLAEEDTESKEELFACCFLVPDCSCIELGNNS